jgi:hypothetical protein
MDSDTQGICRTHAHRRRDRPLRARSHLSGHGPTTRTMPSPRGIPSQPHAQIAATPWVSRPRWRRPSWASKWQARHSRRSPTRTSSRWCSASSARASSATPSSLRSSYPLRSKTHRGRPRSPGQCSRRVCPDGLAFHAGTAGSQPYRSQPWRPPLLTALSPLPAPANDARSNTAPAGRSRACPQGRSRRRDGSSRSSRREAVLGPQSLTGIVESRSVGAVRDRTATPRAMTQKAAPARIL